jgi:hypothetical protein
MLKFYKTMATTPALTYGRESWVPSQKDNSRIQATEMKILRRVKGITKLDRVRNEDVTKELGIYAMNKIKQKRTEWRQHIE